MKKLTQGERARKRGLAQVLVAEGKMTDREIAKYLEIPVMALTHWKVEPYFKSQVKLIHSHLEVLRTRTYRLPIIAD